MLRMLIGGWRLLLAEGATGVAGPPGTYTTTDPALVLAASKKAGKEFLNAIDSKITGEQRQLIQASDDQIADNERKFSPEFAALKKEYETKMDKAASPADVQKLKLEFAEKADALIKKHGAPTSTLAQEATKDDVSLMSKVQLDGTAPFNQDVFNTSVGRMSELQARGQGDYQTFGPMGTTQANQLAESLKGNPDVSASVQTTGDGKSFLVVHNKAQGQIESFRSEPGYAFDNPGYPPCVNEHPLASLGAGLAEIARGIAAGVEKRSQDMKTGSGTVMDNLIQGDNVLPAESGTPIKEGPRVEIKWTKPGPINEGPGPVEEMPGPVEEEPSERTTTQTPSGTGTTTTIPPFRSEKPSLAEMTVMGTNIADVDMRGIIQHIEREDGAKGLGYQEYRDSYGGGQSNLSPVGLINNFNSTNARPIALQESAYTMALQHPTWFDDQGKLKPEHKEEAKAELTQNLQQAGMPPNGVAWMVNQAFNDTASRHTSFEGGAAVAKAELQRHPDLNYQQVHAKVEREYNAIKGPGAFANLNPAEQSLYVRTHIEGVERRETLGKVDQALQHNWDGDPNRGDYLKALGSTDKQGNLVPFPNKPWSQLSEAERGRIREFSVQTQISGVADGSWIPDDTRFRANQGDAILRGLELVDPSLRSGGFGSATVNIDPNGKTTITGANGKKLEGKLEGNTFTMTLNGKPISINIETRTTPGAPQKAIDLRHEGASEQFTVNWPPNHPDIRPRSFAETPPINVSRPTPAGDAPSNGTVQYRVGQALQEHGAAFGAGPVKDVSVSAFADGSMLIHTGKSGDNDVLAVHVAPDGTMTELKGTSNAPDQAPPPDGRTTYNSLQAKNKPTITITSTDTVGQPFQPLPTTDQANKVVKKAPDSGLPTTDQANKVVKKALDLCCGGLDTSKWQIDPLQGGGVNVRTFEDGTMLVQTKNGALRFNREGEVINARGQALQPQPTPEQVMRPSTPESPNPAIIPSDQATAIRNRYNYTTSVAQGAPEMGPGVLQSRVESVLANPTYGDQVKQPVHVVVDNQGRIQMEKKEPPGGLLLITPEMVARRVS